MPKPAAKPAALRRKPALDVSITGFIYCSIMMFIGLAAINTQANLLFGVFGLMIGILLVSFLVSGVVLKRVRATRVLPDHMIVGRPGAIVYQLMNRKRFWPSLAVTLTELDGFDAFVRPPSAYMLHAANRMSATIAAEVVPRRRGLVRLDRYQLSTSFPFGFIKRLTRRREADTLIVLPAIGTMRRELMRRFRSAESVGINVRPSSGGNDEFYGVREYRPGENPRRIYWKRSAGAGPMVVKEMTRVSPPKLVLLVDTFERDAMPETLVAVERVIAMAATAIDQSMETGLPVGLAVWTGEWLLIKPDHGKRHRLDLLTALAKLTPNTTADVTALTDRSREMIRRDTTALLLTPYNGVSAPADAARGGPIVLSAAGDSYFEFPDGVNFGLATTSP